MKNHSFILLALITWILPSCTEPATPPENKEPVISPGDSSVVVVPDIDTIFESDGHTPRQLRQVYNNDTTFREWNYQNGVLNGTSRSFYSNGNPYSELNFQEGKKYGPYRTWHPNGQLYLEGQWENDMPAGIWKFYNEDGSLKKEIDAAREKIDMEADTLGRPASR